MRDGGAVSPRVTDLSRVGSPSKNCPKDAAPGSQVAYPDMRVQSNPPTSSKRSNVDAGASGSMMRPTRCPWTSSTARSACAYVLNHIPVAVPASRPSNFALRPDPRRGPTALPPGPMRGGGGSARQRRGKPGKLTNFGLYIARTLITRSPPVGLQV